MTKQQIFLIIALCLCTYILGRVMSSARHYRKTYDKNIGTIFLVSSDTELTSEDLKEGTGMYFMLDKDIGKIQNGTYLVKVETIARKTQSL